MPAAEKRWAAGPLFMQLFYDLIKNNYLQGKRRNVTTPGICNCLQGAGDFRDQTGEAYWSYVSQADHGKMWCPVSSYDQSLKRVWRSGSIIGYLEK